MARKNPDHFRVTFEFHEDTVFVTCSCGQFAGEPNFGDALSWLSMHHEYVTEQHGYHTIYRLEED